MCDNKVSPYVQVEKLIKELPSTPSDFSTADLNSASKGSVSNDGVLQNVESGTNIRETQSILLERIASEMNRLKFYISHSQVYFSPQRTFNFDAFINFVILY